MAKTISKLTKNSLNQNKLKSLQPTSYTIALSKGTIFDKKNADINNIKEVLVLKGIFSETANVYVFTYQFSSF